MRIRPMSPEDADAVLCIFAQGIATGQATYETETGTWAAWDTKFVDACRLVAESDTGEVLGWAAIFRISNRPAYSGVAEVSLYVAETARGQGVGKALMYALVTSSEEAGFWTLQAGIFPENKESLGLHAAFGFAEVGVRQRMGLMPSLPHIGGSHKGQWRDVVLMERRSTVVGI